MFIFENYGNSLIIFTLNLQSFEARLCAVAIHG
jgi:hypothetical protein